MRTLRPTLLLVLCLAGAPAVAWAQVGPEAVLSDPGLASVHDRLASAIQAANAAGLPPQWLEDKVAEGLAKHVPAPLIAAAVEQLLGRMRVADGILDRARIHTSRAHREAVLRATVDALSSGADPRTVGQLAVMAARVDHQQPWRGVRETMITVAELGERGFDMSYAIAVTKRALARAGVRGLSRLLDAARAVQGRDPAQRQRALDTALDHALDRGASVDHGADRPDDHGGPAHDDSLDQGQHRGRPTRAP